VGVVAGGDWCDLLLWARRTLTGLHPGATVEQAREATGWELKVAEDLQTTEPPTDKELEVLRDLKARTEASRRKT
ncbi:MAG: hypothetical protein WKF44_08190, partial [Rubrobacteraceae bacterium]